MLKFTFLDTLHYSSLQNELIIDIKCELDVNYHTFLIVTQSACYSFKSAMSQGVHTTVET